jgi:hypothetical protein
MNPAVSFDQFTRLAARDSQAFSVVQITESAPNWLLRLLIAPAYLFFFIYAQFAPFIFRKHLEVIFPALPYIKERESLYWLRDTFRLYYHTLKFYRSASLFRPQVDEILDRLDEEIDSLNFALQNEPFLKQVIETIEQRQ